MSLLAGQAIASAQQHPTRGGADLVGEERVVGDAGRQQPLGPPDDEHPVDVEPDGLADGGEVDPDPGLPYAGQVARELEVEQVTQGGEGGGAGDGVEGVHAGEDRLDADRRPLLLRAVPVAGRTEQVGPQGQGGAGQLGPGRGGVEPGQLRADVVDERVQRAGVGRFSVQPVGEPGAWLLLAAFLRCVGRSARSQVLYALPVRAAHHTCAAAHAFPARRGCAAAVPPDGGVGDESEDGVALQVAVEQAEQAPDGASGLEFGGRSHTAAVHRHVGAGQVLVEQSGVGVGAAEQHGDLVARVVGQGLQHGADDLADLVVGVGRGDDLDGQRLGQVRGRQGPKCEHRSVGLRHAGDPGQHGERREPADLAHKRDLGPVEVLREEEHGRGFVTRRLERLGEQVVLVEERAAPLRADQLVQAHDVAHHRQAGAEVRELNVGERPERAVRAREGLNGGRVLGDRCEQTRAAREHLTDDAGQHGAGQRALALLGKPLPGPLFREAPDREDLERGDPGGARHSPRERSAGRDPDPVGGDQHPDLAERMTVLEFGDRRGQGGVGGSAVRGGARVDGHGRVLAMVLAWSRAARRLISPSSRTCPIEIAGTLM